MANGDEKYKLPPSDVEVDIDAEDMIDSSDDDGSADLGAVTQEQINETNPIINLQASVLSTTSTDPIVKGDITPETSSTETPASESVGNPYIISSEDKAVSIIPHGGIFYNTVSCPCSTYVIKDSNNNIGCEREYYGVKQYFKPLIRNNHFLENKLPVLGDKWACEDKTCIQSGYTFDGFYIVEVTENKTDISSSIVNSKRYTDNCFIPKALYFSDYTTTPPKELLEIFKQDEVTTINNVPIFEHDSVANMYNKYMDSSNDNAEDYDFNGIKGWAPSSVSINNKLIVSCKFGNNNLLSRSISTGFTEETDNTSIDGKTIIKAVGETIPIRINGLNSPMFSLTIKDSSGCSILEKQIKNFSLPESGEYILYQKFPNISTGKTSEIYTLKITPSADTHYYYSDHLHKTGVIQKKIYQFVNPTLTITKDTCTDCGSHSISGDDKTISGEAFSNSSNDNSFSAITHSFTITASSTQLYYVNKGLSFDDCFVSNDVIKKVINKPEDTKDIDYSSTFNIQDQSTAVGTESSGFTPSYSGDIKPGMNFTTTVEKTKTVRKIIELDTLPDDDCVDCDENRPIRTNKFDVDNTNDLFTGMIVTNNNFQSYIVSIDCEKTVTIAHEQIVHVGETFVFSHTDHSQVTVVGDKGKYGTSISTKTPIRIPHGTELIFKKPGASRISGTIQVDKTGAGDITVTTKIDNVKFGQEDVTFTIDPDLFITSKPPARDMYVNIGKNSTSNYLHIISNYNNYNDSSKTVRIDVDSQNGTTATPDRGETSLVHYRTYDPAANYVGRDKIKYSVYDGVTYSDEKTIFITVK